MSEVRIQPASQTLVPGETARIPIRIVLDEPLKVRGLHATFHGAEETTATVTTYNAATKSTQTHTVVEHVDIVKTEYLLSGRERQGFLSNVADAFATLLGGGEHDVLDPGEYTFEIELTVPADARPSFEGGKCRVFYELSVIVDIPLARDMKALESFQVRGPSTDADRPAPAPVRTRFPDDQEPGGCSTRGSAGDSGGSRPESRCVCRRRNHRRDSPARNSRTTRTPGDQCPADLG